MNTSMLEEELAPLNAQIKQAQQKRGALEEELRTIEAELKTFSDDRQRFDALRDVCNALDKLGELKADDLFWGRIPETNDVSGHMKRVRGRVDRFEEEIRGILEKQTSLQEQIDLCLDELAMLYEEVRDAYDREERRKEEFVVEREISSVPYREMIMPWTKEAVSESRFRRAVLVALLLCLILGGPVPLINVPLPDISVAVVEIPKRLVKLVKKEPVMSAPMEKPETKLAKAEPKKPKKDSEQAKEKPKQAKEKPKPRHEQKKANERPKGGSTSPKPTKVAGGGGGVSAARKTAKHVGVLAFSDAFKDLMKETPVAKLGTEARLSHKSERVAGRAVPQRSLVTRQAQDNSSGGIGTAEVSRNIGNGNVDRIGGFGIGIGSGYGNGTGNGYGNGTGNGVGIVRVKSTIANLEESSRPLSDGLAAGRTDEEIQIVFDRYKAALYRIYNRELRKDPTLRGKILLRISIEPNGEVSLCRMESTDLASPELVAKIVERIKRFNFGPKEGIPKVTILYPIDFLPAG